MAGGRQYYRGIQGSAALLTAPLASEPAVARAEALAPGEMRRVALGDELIGAAHVRSRFAALPLEAFDRAGGILSALEQGTYLQLLRLAFGEGRNFCRAGKRDLMARLSLSERRLNRVLSALVEKRFIRPLHRDNRGTLWRVYLPREAFGEAVGDDVLLGRPVPARAAPARAPVTALAPRRGGAALAGLARGLAMARGLAPTPEAMAATAAEIAELLDEGHSVRQVEACVRAVARRREALDQKGAAS